MKKEFEEWAERAELVRLLYQRHRDLGDMLARKADAGVTTTEVRLRRTCKSPTG